MNKACVYNVVTYPVGTTGVQFIRHGIRFIKDTGDTLQCWNFGRQQWVDMTGVMYNYYQLPEFLV